MSLSGAVRWEAPELQRASAGTPAPGPSIEELERISEQAREEGYQAGHAEGYEAGMAQAQGEVRRLTAQVEGLLDAFARPLGQLDNEIEQALSELAVQVAGALVGRRYQAEPELLAELVAEAVRMAGPASREVEVRLHPDDLAAINPMLSALPAGTRLQADDNLARGDVRVHAESMRLDARMSARLQTALAGLAMRPEPGDERDDEAPR
ncbi:MAG: FliH/SctL family protein [Lysobacteraceae bacterium]